MEDFARENMHLEFNTTFNKQHVTVCENATKQDARIGFIGHFVATNTSLSS